MSSYANYDDISSHYDGQRKAVGDDIIAGMISKRKPLQEVHLLDVGCGTGNYAKALLEYGVGSISLVDGSEGMLKRAKEKLDKAHFSSAMRDIKLTRLPSLPFNDNTFDAVMINQVLHHLENNPDGISFPNIDGTFGEIGRVLKPGGNLIITTSTPEQVRGLWFTNLMPDVQQRWIKRCPSLQSIEDILRNNGLTVVSALAYLGYDMYSGYDNVEGPLYEAWRNMDSFWSMASEGELRECMKLVTELKEKDTLETFFKDNDKSFVKGTFTIIEAEFKKMTKTI